MASRSLFRRGVRPAAAAFLLVPFALSGAARQGSEPSKLGGERRPVTVQLDADGTQLDEVEQKLDEIRAGGSVRHVRTRSDGRVAAVYGDLGRLAATTDDAAITFVADSAALTGLADARSELVVDRRATSAVGDRISLRQTLGTYDVFDAGATVAVRPDGRVVALTSTVAPNLDVTLAEATPAIDADAARATALSAVGATPERVRSDDTATTVLGVSPVDGGRLSWRVVVALSDPYGQWQVDVDALSGQVIGDPRSLVASAGRARVFVPNPIVSTGDLSLVDQNNAASAVPDSAYIPMDLNGLDSSGFVSGTYVTTDRTSNRATAAGGDFTSLRRNDRGFDEVQAYWAIDYAQRYIRSLGIANAANYQIRVAVHAFSDDNSNYTATGNGRGVLNFGDGGVDDSQDAEIVWHEYGHAVLDNQAQIRLGTGESGAIHEGWGDYVAATLSTTVPGDPKFYPTIGEWDASSYSNARPPFLRRVDGDKRYPQDIDGEVHDDGELWSACLWGINRQIGRGTADRIFFNANFLFPTDATFADAAAAILETDGQLNGGANAAAIRSVFSAHGISLAATAPVVTGVKRQKAKLVVDGFDFQTGAAVVEVGGVAYGSLKYPKAYRRKGVSRRVTSKDVRVASLPAGVTVQVTVFNPSSGLRSAEFSFTP